LCREDELRYKAPGTPSYETIKTFDVDSTLPTGRMVDNTSIFTFPSDAPEGEYLLVSKIYDPANKMTVYAQTDFPFTTLPDGTVAVPPSR
jgi:hypothetical protein